MRVCYCEDEQGAAQYLETKIRGWEKTNQPVDLEWFVGGDAFLFAYPDSVPFDLLILDIEMPGMSGMELARRIRKMDEKVPIVFLTNRKDYVFEGYEVDAYRYLMKPVTQDKISELLSDIKQRKKEKKQYLIETIEQEIVKIDVSLLQYIETDGHYLILHGKEKEWRMKKALSQLKNQINSLDWEEKRNPFIETHRCYLVHLGYVARVTRTECILDNGTQIPVSRNAYQKLNDGFISYYRKREA